MLRRFLTFVAPVVAALTVASPAGAQIFPTLPTTTTTTTSTTSTTAATTTTTSSSTTTSVAAAPSSSLAITVPSSADAGDRSGTAGTTFSLSLGTVRVDDARPGLARSWIATVSATSFTGSGGTIATSAIRYWSGAATATSGLVVAVPGQLTSITAVSLDTARTAFAATGGTGTTAVSWQPTLVVTVPSGVFSGSYTGTITHSVA